MEINGTRGYHATLGVRRGWKIGDSHKAALLQHFLQPAQKAAVDSMDIPSHSCKLAMEPGVTSVVPMLNLKHLFSHAAGCTTATIYSC